jgi:hypothetical protein
MASNLDQPGTSRHDQICVTVIVMQSQDRTAIIGIVIGLAWGALTMAGPLAFPGAPIWVWQASFAIAGVVVVGGAILLVYDFAVRPRLKGRPKLDPFLFIATTAFVVGLAALGIYIIRGPQQIAGQPGAPNATLFINNPAPKPVRASLPPSEKERLSNVLFGLSDLFHKASDIGNRTKDFLEKSRNRPLSDQRVELEGISRDAGQLYQVIFREYREKNQYYNRDISNIVQNDGAFHALLDAINDYMVTIDRLNDTPQTNAIMILEVPAKQIVKANRDVSVWIAEAFKRIETIRAEMNG